MILVSACLADGPCRYDGKSCSNEAVQELVRQGKALPLCPEQLAGLPTPRESCELVVSEDMVKVLGRSGRDYTKEFEQGAAATLALCKANDITEAIFKSNSPSCGCGKIYDGTFSGALKDGDGITTALLKKNGIQVRTEESRDARTKPER